MGRQVRSKPMRVYSLEPKKSLDLAFARNYVNQLVPSLKKRMAMNVGRSSLTTTSTRSTSDENGNAELAKIIRFEVDMALALSAKGFGWSHALEAKLKRSRVVNINGGIRLSFSSSSHKISSSPYQPFTMKTTAINVQSKVFENRVLVLPPNSSASENPKCDPLVMKKLLCPKSRRLRSRKVQPKKSQEDVMDDKLAHLKTLLPGGNEIEGNGHELLAEIASYITCLKLQVKVLQCLVEDHD